MRQIFAIGGSALKGDQDPLHIESFLSEAVESDRPKICFLPTASGDSQANIDRFYQTFPKSHWRPSHLSLFRPFTSNFRSFLLKQKIIYVGGGSTFNMLQLWRAWKIDDILQEAYNQEIVLAGVSAGAICWFNHGLSQKLPDQYQAISGLSLLSGSCCPHFNQGEKRQSLFHQMIQKQTIDPGIGLEDDSAILYRDEKIHRTFARNPGINIHSIGPELVSQIPINDYLTK